MKFIPAWSMPSIPAPARRPGREYGLRKFPAAGKTGTAYDFTDALFVGYDSAITCAVWSGFDKPQKIYRGAFGHVIALPVWVDVMNASVDHYPPREIPRPRDLKKVEICSRSGLLATDRCYDTIKGPNGDPVQHRTTYMEIGTPAQLPTAPCNVHGEPRARLVQEETESEFPRAASAVDLNQVRPVIPKEPTLLAKKDPYDATGATVQPTPLPTPLAETQTAASFERPSPNRSCNHSRSPNRNRRKRPRPSPARPNPGRRS